MLRWRRNVALTILLIAFAIIVLLPVVFAATDLPVGILKAQEYNKELATEFLQKATFFIAFLAGITTIFSPCILPLLPAYFGITFREKRRITLATLQFFIGFTAVFILMGIVATFTGAMLTSVFRDVGWLVPAAGVLLVMFGVMMFLGKGFTGIVSGRKFRSDPFGVAVSGAVFAVGWTACIGPIISGLLLMSATFQNYATASYLMFAYSLGIFVPLFTLSFFYDKLRIDKFKWLTKTKTLVIGQRRFRTNTPNIIAGSLFIILGAIFIIFRGTWIFNGLQMFGLKGYFYSLQKIFMQNIGLFNLLGIIIFFIFAAALAYFLLKETKDKKINKRM